MNHKARFLTKIASRDQSDYNITKGTCRTPTKKNNLDRYLKTSNGIITNKKPKTPMQMLMWKSQSELVAEGGDGEAKPPLMRGRSDSHLLGLKVLII